MSEKLVSGTSVDSLARLYTAEAMGLLVQVARGDIGGAKVSDRVRAAEGILDRGHGRAVQAVISVPARRAVAARLATMSDDQLLRLAGRGSREQNEGPVPPGAVAGSHGHQANSPVGSADSPVKPVNSSGNYDEASPADFEAPRDLTGPVLLPPPLKRGAHRNVPQVHRDADIVDAEIEVDPLG